MAIVVSGNSITFEDNSKVQGLAINGYSPYMAFDNLIRIAGRAEFTGNTVFTPSTEYNNTAIFLSNIAFFNSSNTFTVPSDVYKVGVVVIGGGRGGTNPTSIPGPPANDGSYQPPIPVPGAPGFSAGLAINYVPVTPFDNILVTVGAGGSAGGGLGGTSKFGNVLSYCSSTNPTNNSLINVRVESSTANSVLNNSNRPIIIATPGNTYLETISTQHVYRSSANSNLYVITSTIRPGAGGVVSTSAMGGLVMVLY